MLREYLSNGPEILEEIAIQQQKETREKVIKTKEIFKDTGILETFQKIIDTKTVLFSKEPNFTNLPEEQLKVIPAKIGYDLDKVSLFFAAYYSKKGREKKYHLPKISVKKNNDNSFSLETPFSGQLWHAPYSSM